MTKLTYKEYDHRCSGQVETHGTNIGKEEHAAFPIILESRDSPITFLYPLCAIDCHGINSVDLKYLQIVRVYEWHGFACSMDSTYREDQRCHHSELMINQDLSRSFVQRGHLYGFISLKWCPKKVWRHICTRTGYPWSVEDRELVGTNDVWVLGAVVERHRSE